MTLGNGSSALEPGLDVRDVRRQLAAAKGMDKIDLLLSAPDPLALSVRVVRGGAAMVSADGSQRVPVPTGNVGRITTAGEVIVAPAVDSLTRGKPE